MKTKFNKQFLTIVFILCLINSVKSQCPYVGNIYTTCYAYPDTLYGYTDFYFAYGITSYNSPPDYNGQANINFFTPSLTELVLDTRSINLLSNHSVSLYGINFPSNYLDIGYYDPVTKILTLKITTSFISNPACNLPFTFLEQSPQGISLVWIKYPPYNISTATSICENDTLSFGTQILTASGVYTETFTSVNGADSTVTLTLSVNPKYSIQNEVQLCVGDSLFVGGSWQKTIGIYYDSLQTVLGCDSIIETHLNFGSYPQTSISGINNVCFGLSNGTADVTVSGGTSPFSYNWSNGQSTEQIDNLFAGNYYLTVTDNNGCSASDSVTIYEYTEITYNSILTTATCYGGSDGACIISTNSDHPIYSILWTNGMSGDTITNLSFGTYSFVITDSLGCTLTDSIAISQASEMISEITVGNVTCFGGSDGYCTIISNGGTAPYSYHWSNGINNDAISNLTNGTYLVTITDSNNCNIIDTAIVTQSLQIFISGSVTNSTGSNGAINISIINGFSPFTYLWSNGAITEDISGLAVGGYTVTVTDSKGCHRSNTFTVFFDCNNSSLNINLSVTNCTSNNTSDGSINAVVTGGTSPYSYHWSNGSNYTNIEYLSFGNYCFTVTDANNCKKSQCANVYVDTLIANDYLDSNTIIEVCFTANHTYVSDIGFYLLAPFYGPNMPNAAIPGQIGVVELLPSVSSWDDVSSLPHSVVSCDPSDINFVCNGGNDVVDFCFTTNEPFGNPAYTACVCDLTTPLTGTYASAGPWSTVYSFPIDIGGWSVQVYDCESYDFGTLTNVRIKFTQGSNVYFYNSGTISKPINDNSCSYGNASIYTFNISSVSNNVIENTINEIKVFPNPAKDEVFIETSNFKLQTSNLKLYSIDGRMVKEEKLEEQKTRISTKDLESGVYFIEVSVGNEKINSKLVITK